MTNFAARRAWTVCHTTGTESIYIYIFFSFIVFFTSINICWITLRREESDPTNVSSSDVLHFLAFSELPVVLWGNVLVTMVISETSSFTRIIFKYLALPLCDVFKHSLCRHLLDRNILKHAAEYEVTKQLEHFVSENRKYIKK